MKWGLFFCFLLLAEKSPCKAVINYYQNQTPVSLVNDFTRVTGSFGNDYSSSTRLNFANSVVSLRVGFDTLSLKMWVDQVTLNAAIDPKTMVKTLTDVNGISKEITTTITFNPITISYSEIGNDLNGPIYRDITPGSGGAYSLNWRTVSAYQGKISADPYITGTYSVSGPTQTRTGSFAINFNAVNLSLPDFINLSKPNEEVIFANVLTGSPYPLTIMPFLPSSHPGTDPIFYSVVDDVNVATGLSLSSFYLDAGQLKLEAIPEPSSLSLLVVGGTVLMAGRRRNRD